MSIHKRKKKDGVSWRVIIQVNAKKQISKTFAKKIDAERWESGQKHLINSVPAHMQIQNKMTVAQLASHWLKHYAVNHKAESSVVRDRQFLKHQILPYLGSKDLSSLSPREIEFWLTTIRDDQELSVKTCNNALGLLRKMLNDAVRWQFVACNPASSVRPFRVVQKDFEFWTMDESRCVLSYARVHEPDDFPVYATALSTGMRRGELGGLKWDCVDFSLKLITVKRTYCDHTDKLKESTKNKLIRRIPINRDLLAILVELKRTSTSDYLFPKYGFHNAPTRLRKLAEAAGVKPLRFHDMRHTFASNFMMAGGLIYDLQKILGHQTITMTERYSHLSPTHLVGKTEILDFGVSETNNVIHFAAGSGS